MKRAKAVLAMLVLMAAGVASASVVAGKSPAGILQTTSGTTTTTTGTTTTGTTTTGTTTTGTTGTTTTGTTTTTPTPRKVTICHHTRSRKNPHKTITVSSNALAAHVRHGDTPGACPTTSNVTRHSATTHVRRWHRGTTLRAELRAEAKAAKAKGNKGKGKGKGK